MTDKLTVMLPPWMSGDGRLCQTPGRYAYRRVGEKWNGRFATLSSGSLMGKRWEFSGPIEFIEIDPVAEKNAALHTVELILKFNSVEAFNAAVKAMEGK